jgi:hypothetical protein
VEDSIPKVSRAENLAVVGRQGGRRRSRAWIGGPPRPGVHPPVEESSRHRGSRWLSGAECARARPRGRVSRLRLARKVMHQRIDQRLRTPGIFLRGDLMAAAGPRRARRATTIQHQDHKCPGSGSRRLPEVSWHHLDHDSNRTALSFTQGNRQTFDSLECSLSSNRVKEWTARIQYPLSRGISSRPIELSQDGVGGETSRDGGLLVRKGPDNDRLTTATLVTVTRSLANRRLGHVVEMG